MVISDSIEEFHSVANTPFGEHILRYIRVADNNVLLIVDGKITALFTVDEQQRFMGWLARRVQENIQEAS